jgi:hypothetical protein
MRRGSIGGAPRLTFFFFTMNGWLDAGGAGLDAAGGIVRPDGVAARTGGCAALAGVFAFSGRARFTGALAFAAFVAFPFAIELSVPPGRADRSAAPAAVSTIARGV